MPPPSWVYFQALPEHGDPSCAGCCSPSPHHFAACGPLCPRLRSGAGATPSLTEAQQSWGFCCLPTKNLVPESHRALSKRFLPESSNESWLKSPNQTVLPMEIGNQPLASCSVEQPRPLGGSVAAHEAPVAAEATCGRREERALGQGRPVWGGAGKPVPERACPGLGAGSYLLLQQCCPLCSFISGMTAQHRINSELNLRKKGLRDFGFCFSQDSPGLFWFYL